MLKLEFVLSQIRFLLHASPKTYRLLQRVFDLPSVKTLRVAMRRVSVYPGFNQHILDALQKKLATTPEHSKVVAVVIDEMAVKEGLTYDKARDVIEGFSEGVSRSKELANHAIAFMARGLVEKWKQPVGYFLSSGPMGGSEMNILLQQCIDKLTHIGLTVLVVIGD